MSNISVGSGNTGGGIFWLVLFLFVVLFYNFDGNEKDLYDLLYANLAEGIERP